MEQAKSSNRGPRKSKEWGDWRHAFSNENGSSEGDRQVGEVGEGGGEGGGEDSVEEGGGGVKPRAQQRPGEGEEGSEGDACYGEHL